MKLKILGCHFSHNRILQQENNYNRHISKIENVFKVWRREHLTLEEKINVFKSFAISKIIHLSVVSPISPTSTIKKYSSGKVNIPKSNMKLCVKISGF